MFKEIPETNGSYSCDENGNIRSNERWVFNNGSGCWYRIQERILKPYVTNKGYHVVDLRIDGETKRFLVNRLVAITWIPNPDNFPIINHKDNDPLNNHYTNLEWCTHQYNTRYSIVLRRRHYDSPAQKTAQRMPKVYLYKPVDQYGMDGSYIATYSSITEASNSITSSVSKSRISNISACCYGKAKSAYGYIWRFKSDENVTTNNEYQNSSGNM